ncbi:MAG: T9SS type A sorting domain-containing protein [Flavobacteriales bacterium]
MTTKIISCICLFLVVLNAKSQLTWSENMAPIVYSHCTKCHHEGGIGPFSLMAYDDMADGAETILEAINTGFMPPWPADPNYQHFAFENVLTDEEIQNIADWIAQGKPEGNPNLAPTPPVYNDDSVLPEIDFTGQTGDYTSTATTHDEFRTFVIDANIASDKYIDAIEVLPGNPSIVHHVLIYYDPTDDCLTLDANDPGPGFSTSGTGGGLPDEVKTIAAWVPGNSPSFLPPGFAFKVEAGGNYLIEIHYPEETDGEVDNTTLNIHYSDSPTPRQVFLDPILYHFAPVLEEGFIYIPANDTVTFHESYQVPIGITLFNVSPHMHLIGRTVTSWGETSADGIIPFIHIDNWDFHWQYTYPFPSLMHVPASTVMKATAFYDNTANNPHQPNDPPQLVIGGEETSDEMMLVFFTYTLYYPGDENIVIDPALQVEDVLTPAFAMQAFPNPASEEVQLSCFSANNESVSCTLMDMNGKIVLQQNLTMKTGMNKLTLPLHNAVAGVYVLNVQGTDMIHSTRIVIDE